MTKFSILIGFQFLISSLGYGQSSTFNIAKSLPYPQGDFFHMVVYEDTIVGYGVGFNNNIEWKQGLVLAKLDTLGNVLAHNFILDDQGDLLNTHKAWGNIIRTTDGGYAAIAATVYRKSAFLVKMTHDLQVEFIEEYPDTVNLSNYFYKLLETPEGYLLYGAIQRPDYYDDGFIRYVDKQGETIWFKYVDHSNYSNGVVSLEKINDTLYVYGMVNGVTPTSSNSSVHLINLKGNNVLSWVSDPEPEIGYIRRIWPTHDEGIIVYGLHVAQIINTTKLVQPTLSKLDSNFQIEWVNHFGRIGSLNASVMLWDFAPTIDGQYIGVGETLIKDGNDPTRRVGWLYKFSMEGDSTWERKINAPFLPLYYTNSGFFAGVGVLSSGSIIAGGSTNEGNTQYCWLVKVTNDGCLDTLFCQPVSTTVPPTVASPGMEIYPNPARDVLRIEYPLGSQGGYVRLFDMQGRLQRELQLPASGNLAEIPVSDISNGLYVARWFCDGQDGFMKVVIAH